MAKLRLTAGSLIEQMVFVFFPMTLKSVTFKNSQFLVDEIALLRVGQK